MVRMIITWSLHNRLVVLLGTVLLVAIGLYSVKNLNVEAYPDPTPPLVEVITQNPGASPEEIERLICVPIEIALNGMPGLRHLRSTSISGLNDIKCVFTYDTDYWKARQEVINRIALLTNLPQGVTLTLSPWSPTGEIVRYVLEGPTYTLNELKAVQDCFLVMVNVLEAAMGGVFALYFTRTHFSISGAVGFISVFGVAVQDGVPLVTCHNQMRERGYSIWETCMRGTELRIRPVVMTSLTAALGLLPAALAVSIGSQAQKPLAIVVVGAMFCTLFLTRYMMPVLYSYFPNPRGHGAGEDDHLVEGTNYSRFFMHHFPPDDGT